MSVSFPNVLVVWVKFILPDWTVLAGMGGEESGGGGDDGRKRELGIGM